MKKLLFLGCKFQNILRICIALFFLIPMMRCQQMSSFNSMSNVPGFSMNSMGSSFNSNPFQTSFPGSDFNPMLGQSSAMFPVQSSATFLGQNSAMSPTRSSALSSSQSSALSSSESSTMSLGTSRLGQFRILTTLFSGLRNSGLEATIAGEVLQRLIKTALKDLIVPFKGNMFSTVQQLVS